jgi:hypothetical protein
MISPISVITLVAELLAPSRRQIGRPEKWTKSYQQNGQPIKANFSSTSGRKLEISFCNSFMSDYLMQSYYL